MCIGLSHNEAKVIVEIIPNETCTRSGCLIIEHSQLLALQSIVIKKRSRIAFDQIQFWYQLGSYPHST